MDVEMEGSENILRALDQQQVEQTPRVPPKVSTVSPIAGTSSSTSNPPSDNYVVSLKTPTSLEQYKKDECLRKIFGFNKESFILISSDSEPDVEIVEARTVADTTNQSSSSNEQPSTGMRIEVSMRRKRRQSAVPIERPRPDSAELSDVSITEAERDSRTQAYQNNVRYLLSLDYDSHIGTQWGYEDEPYSQLAMEFRDRLLIAYTIRGLCNPNDIPYFPYEVPLRGERERIDTCRAKWEDRLNAVCTAAGVAPIYVENWVDDELAPKDFKFIQRNIIRDDVYLEFTHVPKALGVRCECENSCSTSEICCDKFYHKTFAYDEQRVKPNVEYIIECSDQCDCSLSCKNRVLQRGRQIPLVLFRTRECGWSIRAATDIPNNTFIMQYIGEVFTYKEADKRKDHSFQYNMDTRGRCDYVIDAINMGNEGRWINHSCQPNLRTLGVMASRFDEFYNELAFFAARDIKMGEELTINYYAHVDPKETILEAKAMIFE
ncbi:Histone-lysine N-methyltransferase [Aphelenchoides besseyi]|nr:Histone-lysine N-methyltransferase [Aphelenchoides besseyi]KAI6194687.1 Histone-lysine N-methyltransferase [Aphelenchoides besseyi]